MRAALKLQQISRIAHRLEFVHGGSVREWQPDAERIFRVISRTSHHQELGEQRRSAKSRKAMDALIIENVTAALAVL